MRQRHKQRAGGSHPLHTVSNQGPSLPLCKFSSHCCFPPDRFLRLVTGVSVLDSNCVSCVSTAALEDALTKAAEVFSSATCVSRWELSLHVAVVCTHLGDDSV